MADSNANDPPTLNYASPGTVHPSRRRWVLWLSAALLVFILVASIFPLDGGKWEKLASQIQSASNLRQIGSAIGHYNKDYGGEFPDSFQTLFAIEDVTTGVFVSPIKTDTPAVGPTTQATIDQLTAGGHLSYVYLGRGLTTKTVTPNTIIAYEMLDQPNDGTNVLFGDGHVQWFDAPVPAKILARVASGQFPVTMP